MKKYFILIAVLFLSSCASQLELEERAMLRDKIDHEECVSLGFIAVSYTHLRAHET